MLASPPIHNLDNPCLLPRNNLSLDVYIHFRWQYACTRLGQQYVYYDFLCETPSPCLPGYHSSTSSCRGVRAHTFSSSHLTAVQLNGITRNTMCLSFPLSLPCSFGIKDKVFVVLLFFLYFFLLLCIGFISFLRFVLPSDGEVMVLPSFPSLPNAMVLGYVCCLHVLLLPMCIAFAIWYGVMGV